MTKITIDTEDLANLKGFFEGFWKGLLEKQKDSGACPTEYLGQGLAIQRVSMVGMGECIKVTKGRGNQPINRGSGIEMEDSFYLDRMAFAALEQYAERTGFKRRSAL